MGPQEKNDDQHPADQQQQGEQNDGHSGEGAASVMAHLISQGDRNRHPTGEADDAPGTQRQ